MGARPSLAWCCVVWWSVYVCGSASAAPVERESCITWARMVQAVAQMDERNRAHLPELIALPSVPASAARLALRALNYVRTAGVTADDAWHRALAQCGGQLT
ncbi:MAG: hypothetical protein IT495_17170 [Gammaproteobacteria bacterium]|nr:hypothetical protein [Gammaproteobacteria bacterium]